VAPGGPDALSRLNSWGVIEKSVEYCVEPARTVTTWTPAVESTLFAGTTKVSAKKSPLESVLGADNSTDVSPKVAARGLFAGKFDPEIATLSPTGPSSGVGEGSAPTSTTLLVAVALKDCQNTVTL
jgi:hypothetical protein